MPLPGDTTPAYILGSVAETIDSGFCHDFGPAMASSQCFASAFVSECGPSEQLFYAMGVLASSEEAY